MNKPFLSTRNLFVVPAVLLIALCLPSCDLTVTSVLGPSSANAGVAISVSMTVENVALIYDDYEVQFTCVYALSSDKYFSTDDIILHTEETLNPGYLNTVTDSREIIIPANTPGGNYYLLYVAYSYYEWIQNFLDPYHGNNTVAKPITIYGQPNSGPDLTVQAFALPTTNTVAGKSLPLSYRVKNFGIQATGPSILRYYLSEDATLNTGSGGDKFMGEYVIDSIPANGTLDVSHSVPLYIDTWEGFWFLFVQLDATNLVTEYNISGAGESNNVVYRKLFVFNPFPKPEFIVSPSAKGAAPGGTAKMHINWQNDREFDYATIAVAFMLSTDRHLDMNDRCIGLSVVNDLKAGRSCSETVDADIPDDVKPGNYWVLFVDSEKAPAYFLDPSRMPPSAPIRIGGAPEADWAPIPAFGMEYPSAKLKISPNPAIDVASITFTVENGEPYSLSIFDSRGIKIETIEDGKGDSSARQKSFQTDNYEPGMYFVVLQEGNRRFSQKLVIK